MSFHLAEDSTPEAPEEAWTGEEVKKAAVEWVREAPPRPPAQPQFASPFAWTLL